ncbi:MAG: helix-turn-helix domain-containing protein [Pirellulaceae bacterium]|nr:helix-turn-helix domain-containing protein [Pirellulaceae bacterium]
MSADSDSQSKPVQARAGEPSALSTKSIPPRKLARILSDSRRPFYLLDHKDRIRFANQALVETLGTTDEKLIGLDCVRVVAHDEHTSPILAGLLAIPENARSSQISFSPIGLVDPSLKPWTARLVIPLENVGAAGYVACFFLSSDDPLVVQASQHVDWMAQADIRKALLDTRRTLVRLDGLHSLIGNSSSVQLARRQVQAASAGSMSVCLYGPTGSHKSALVRAIYQQRRKRERRMLSEGRLLSIDCRLMDRSLMLDTLELAHEPDSSHRTEVESEPTALLLAGIDQLLPEALPPLMQFLAERPATTVFATSQAKKLMGLHRDPSWHELVATISIIEIHIEPLAHRVDDIAPLAESIVEECRIATAHQTRRSLSPTAMQWLQAYPWPGNHREMQQAIREAYRRSTTSHIEATDFSLAIRTFASHVLRPEPLAPIELDKALEIFERGLLQSAIDAFPRNRAAAARHLGISRTRLLRRLEQLGLEATVSEREETSSPQLPSDATPASDQPVFEEIHDHDEP